MIKCTYAYKTTNKESEGLHWPILLACKPEVGEFVKSKEGIAYKITAITHVYQDVYQEASIRITLDNDTDNRTF